MIEFDSSFLVFAQDGGAPGTEAGPPAATGASGSPAGGAPAKTPGFDPMFMIIIFGVLIMLFLSTFGQRKEKKRRQALLGALKKHDRVQTVGGVIGSIVEMKPDTVVLKVDESSNTRISFARSAVQQVLETKGVGSEIELEKTTR